jgi:hypothetical protein
MTMAIEFTPDESFEQHRRSVVWFSAVDDPKVINCAISIDALIEHFGAYADDPLPAFRTHRQEIWERAAELISRATIRRRWHDRHPQRRHHAGAEQRSDGAGF